MNTKIHFVLMFGLVRFYCTHYLCPNCPNTNTSIKVCMHTPFWSLFGKITLAMQKFITDAIQNGCQIFSLQKNVKQHTGSTQCVYSTFDIYKLRRSRSKMISPIYDNMQVSSTNWFCKFSDLSYVVMSSIIVTSLQWNIVDTLPVI